MEKHIIIPDVRNAAKTKSIGNPKQNWIDKMDIKYVVNVKYKKIY